MQQLSRPYQIALGALLVLALAWFTFLKPSAAAEEVAPPPGASAGTTAPGVAGLGRAVDKANGAAAASDANAGASQAAAADPAGEPAVSSTSTRAAAKKLRPSGTGPIAAKPPRADPSKPVDPSARILRDVARGKVAVLLFFNREAADDRAVRRALRAADRYGGKVVIRSVPIARIARYPALLKGIDVRQSPTVLVIGKGNRARTLVGYADTRAIDQLVSDVGGAEFRRRR
jgi:hypothetical protein